MVGILAQSSYHDDGIIGFNRAEFSLSSSAPNNQPNETELECITRVFKADDDLQNYLLERDSGLIANCHGLLALIHTENTASYYTQVETITKSICEYWWNADSYFGEERRSLCSLYPHMLLAQALTDLLVFLDERPSESVLDEDLRARVLITLFQTCTRPLMEQNDDGSWNNSVAQTSYATLTLVETRRLPIFNDIRVQIETAIQSAILFIESQGDDITALKRIWNERVSCNRSVHMQAYKSAASNPSAKAVESTPGNNTQTPANPFLKLLQKTPLFSGVSEWKLRCSYIESTCFRPLLRSRRLLIFSRTNVTEDKYFDMIPFTWTACNNRVGTYASNTLLFEMMIISFLNYQVDEYMEAVAGPIIKGLSSEVHQLVDHIFAGDGQPKDAPAILSPLANFTSHVLQGQLVTQASAPNQVNLRRELELFIRAHITQAEDNARLAARGDDTGFTKPDMTFFGWVHSTSADHTSCPYSFAFLECLLSRSIGQGAECFPTTEQKYYASDACRHLATMCRMYNDYGSTQRDAEEKNLNSIDFADFAGSADKKQTLFELAEYERSCLQSALDRLEHHTRLAARKRSCLGWREERKLTVVRMFCDITDLYGQLYVVRDIASRIKLPTKG